MFLPASFKGGESIGSYPRGLPKPSHLTIPETPMKAFALATACLSAVCLSSATAAGPAPRPLSSVTGEVLDLVCYLDHGASGPAHAGCAGHCIEHGSPVGLKGTDRRTYVIVGEPATLAKTFGPLAAKNVTLRGEVLHRDGLNMIRNFEVVNP